MGLPNRLLQSDLNKYRSIKCSINTCCYQKSLQNELFLSIYTFQTTFISVLLSNIAEIEVKIIITEVGSHETESMQLNLCFCNNFCFYNNAGKNCMLIAIYCHNAL